MTIIVLALVLLSQILFIATGGTYKKSVDATDDLAGTSNASDGARGYVQYFIVGGVLGLVVCLYLIVMKIIDKCISEIVDYAAFHTMLVFLFALCYLGIAASSNNKTTIDANKTAKSQLEAAGTTSGKLYEAYSTYKIT